MTDPVEIPEIEEEPQDVLAETPEDLQATTRPDDLPDKFWDEDAGAVRVDALVKSYGELERKLGGLGSRMVPESPEDYAIEAADEIFAADPEVNTVLHDAGFSQEQAQLVYDLAAERLGPMIRAYAADVAAQEQVGRLKDHFGGDERWSETARQLSTWGQAHLPDEVFGALSASYEGVLALHNMMKNGEPGLVRPGSQAGNGEADLRGLMKDPKYWRERDPAFVEKVADGFRRLYGQG